MIKIVFTIAALWCASITAAAQDTSGIRYVHSVVAHPDTLVPYLKFSPGYRMPIAGAGKPLLYKGKAGKGYSLYQSMHDNMPVLVPDSTFRSAMPVKKISPLDNDTVQMIIPPPGKYRQFKPLPSYQ